MGKCERLGRKRLADFEAPTSCAADECTSGQSVSSLRVVRLGQVSVSSIRVGRPAGCEAGRACEAVRPRGDCEAARLFVGRRGFFWGGEAFCGAARFFVGRRGFL